MKKHPYLIAGIVGSVIALTGFIFHTADPARSAMAIGMAIVGLSAAGFLGHLNIK